MKLFFYLSLVVLSTTTLSGCRKFLEIDSPVTKVDAEQVYVKDATAIAAMTSIYQEMSSSGIFQGTNSISLFAGLLGDELKSYNFNPLHTAAYQNQLGVSTNNPTSYWQRLYFLIYTSNSVIEGVSASTTLSANVKQQLLGEAKFMRAFLYFNLVNLYGDVPLHLSTDYRVNNIASRAPMDKVYEQITVDLTEAKALLTDKYLSSDLKTIIADRVRPNKSAATALLARVYLYSKNYVAAENTATELLTQPANFDLLALNKVFVVGSKEIIWQIQAINPVANTYDARAFIINSAPTGGQPVSLSNQLLSAFEAGDNRREIWVGKVTTAGVTYNYPYKYKVNTSNAPITEGLVVFRLAEQYLIRAEARIAQNKISEAVADLNIIRTRARAPISASLPDPLPNLSEAISPDDLKAALLHERQVELFSEWGHRWFDLKRIGKVNNVMAIVTPLKGGGDWNANKALLPIPSAEVIRNPNIAPNPGY